MLGNCIKSLRAYTRRHARCSRRRGFSIGHHLNHRNSIPSAAAAAASRSSPVIPPNRTMTWLVVCLILVSENKHTRTTLLQCSTTSSHMCVSWCASVCILMWHSSCSLSHARFRCVNILTGTQSEPLFAFRTHLLASKLLPLAVTLLSSRAAELLVV